MPFNLIPDKIRSYFNSSRAPRTGHFNVLGERLPREHCFRENALGQAQALHQADMMLAQRPLLYYAQLYPPRHPPRLFGTAEALHDPECIFLPPPALKLPTPSGLCERRRHHDRNPCGLNTILKPAVLASQVPLVNLDWVVEEHREQLMVEQRRLHTRKFAGSYPEVRDRTSAQAVEDQLRDHLKSPRQGRIPLAELQKALDASKHWEEDPTLFSVKEKIAIRNLRREIAKFPQIRADVLAAFPEMTTHPLYCTNEHLKKLGVDTWWDRPEESDDGSPSQIPRLLPVQAHESSRGQRQRDAAVSGFWESSSKWEVLERSVSTSTAAETTASDALGIKHSPLDLKEKRETARPDLSTKVLWTGRRLESPPANGKPIRSLAEELLDVDYESSNGEVESTNDESESLDRDLESSNGEINSTIGDPCPNSVDGEFVDLDSSDDGSLQVITIDDLENPLEDIFQIE